MCEVRSTELNTTATSSNSPQDHLTDYSLTYSHTPCDSLRIIPSFLNIQIPPDQINSINPISFKKRSIRSSSSPNPIQVLRVVEPKQLQFRYVSKSLVIEPMNRKKNKSVIVRRIQTEVSRERSLVRRKLVTVIDRPSSKCKQTTPTPIYKARKDPAKNLQNIKVSMKDFLSIRSQHIKLLFNRRRMFHLREKQPRPYANAR